MTLPVERTRAVCATRSFLARLLRPADTPRVPSAVRKEASALLRHYPGEVDLLDAACGAPATWAPPHGLEGLLRAQAGMDAGSLDALRLAVAERQRCQQAYADFVNTIRQGGGAPTAVEKAEEAWLSCALTMAERAVLDAAEAFAARR